MDKDSEEGFKEIKPAPFNRAAENPAAPTSTNSISLKTLNITLGLAILLISLIIVIFFLPDWVENNKPTGPNEVANNAAVDTSSKVSTTTMPPASSYPATKQLSPQEQAQNIALRKEAQSYLQDILEKQNRLEENNAESWAAEEYVTGLNHATSGDTFYNQQQFEQASKEYQQALAIFNPLSEKIETLYKENIENGQNALDIGNSNVALAAFKTASLFTDESLMAANGFERAQKLDDVFATIEQGDEALNDDRLVEAKEAYQAALKLDPETKLAKQRLQETNRLLADKQFNAFMSAGYTALDQQIFVTALNQFNKALKIKPNATAAKTALQQTKHQATTLDIANTLKHAAASENDEQWQTAIDLYSNALKLEKNLAEAQTGKQRSQSRLAINQRLELILSRPERLSDKKVHAETADFYNEASKLSNQGPILAKQLADLENLLQVSATPVKIQLESDNLTDVVIYKVGKMGIFELKNLSLRPGKYVAVGKRDGYRDVRIVFLVSQDTNKQAIRIAAKEKIN
jgi:tetratricopeptide (TPR) repeat protein